MFHMSSHQLRTTLVTQYPDGDQSAAQSFQHHGVHCGTRLYQSGSVLLYDWALDNSRKWRIAERLHFLEIHSSVFNVHGIENCAQMGSRQHLYHSIHNGVSFNLHYVVLFSSVNIITLVSVRIHCYSPAFQPMYSSFTAANMTNYDY